MLLSNRKILITGGSSGIGLEMASRFSQLNNRVIICGRSPLKLQKARQEVKDLIPYRCDLSDPGECHQFINWIKDQHSDLSMLVNNAAIVHRTNFTEDPEAMHKFEKELGTNLIAPVRLVNTLIPVLNQNPDPAIINVTTGLVYAPRAIYPFYNATKAALHAFTQGLRIQLEGSEIRVFEVMFPAVDTPWHKGNPPKIAIPAEQAVREMISSLEKGKYEIRIAGVKMLYLLHRIMPSFTLRKMNSLE